ncbi:MAG: DUF423 domain-containing protein [Leptospirales bacterium]|nr:DUF423 domain-containing protein [Leptospirales bacterium]
MSPISVEIPRPARLILLLAAILGGLSVALGAFGAHGLRQMVGPREQEIFETAVRYQFYHCFALALVGVLGILAPPRARWWRLAAIAFVAGLFLFCGALYAIVFGAPRWFGAVAPLGGLSFIVGWMLLAIGLGSKSASTLQR